MNVTLCEESMSPFAIQADTIPHLEVTYADCAMACVPPAVRCDGKIATACAAWVWRTRAACDLFERYCKIGKTDRPARAGPCNFVPGNALQSFKIQGPMRVSQCFTAAFIHSQGCKANFRETDFKDLGKPSLQVKIVARNRCTCSNFRLSGLSQQRCDGLL